MYDGEKLIVDKGNIPEGNKAIIKGTETSSPSSYRNIDIEANGVEANAGSVYDLAEDVRKTTKLKFEEAVKNNDGEAAEKALKEMRDASEILGEVSAEAWAKNKFPDAEKLEAELPGGGKQGQFDQIFIDESSGKLIIIEAKGGGSPLGGRMVTKDKNGNDIEPPARYQQGTKEYMDDVIWNYKKKLEEAEKTGNLTPDQLEALEDTVGHL